MLAALSVRSNDDRAVSADERRGLRVGLGTGVASSGRQELLGGLMLSLAQGVGELRGVAGEIAVDLGPQPDPGLPVDDDEDHRCSHHHHAGHPDGQPTPHTVDPDRM